MKVYSYFICETFSKLLDPDLITNCPVKPRGPFRPIRTKLHMFNKLVPKQKVDQNVMYLKVGKG